MDKPSEKDAEAPKLDAEASKSDAETPTSDPATTKGRKWLLGKIGLCCFVVGAATSAALTLGP
ncbi:MAG: hypothetical protein AAGA01_13465, partial [Cyanobacteria bacterium P01_E01_bin.43]